MMYICYITPIQSWELKGPTTQAARRVLLEHARGAAVALPGNTALQYMASEVQGNLH